MTQIIKNAKLYSVSMVNNSLQPTAGWVNMGYTTNFTYVPENTRKRPRPYAYLVALDNKDGEKYKVHWKNDPIHEDWQDVFVGANVHVGSVHKHLDGWWSCKDRFGTINRGFASRRMASMFILENHFQFTPSLETIDDYNKQL